MLLGLLVIAPTFMQSCDDGPNFQVGCLSGIARGTNTRFFLECMTRNDFAAGAFLPGTSLYDNLVWTPVDNCRDCGTLDYENL